MLKQASNRTLHIAHCLLAYRTCIQMDNTYFLGGRNDFQIVKESLARLNVLVEVMLGVGLLHAILLHGLRMYV